MQGPRHVVSEGSPRLLLFLKKSKHVSCEFDECRVDTALIFASCVIHRPLVCPTYGCDGEMLIATMLATLHAFFF